MVPPFTYPARARVGAVMTIPRSSATVDGGPSIGCRVPRSRDEIVRDPVGLLGDLVVHALSGVVVGRCDPSDDRQPLFARALPECFEEGSACTLAARIRCDEEVVEIQAATAVERTAELAHVRQ